MLHVPKVYAAQSMENTESICTVDMDLPQTKKDLRNFAKDSNDCVSRKMKKGAELKRHQIPSDRIEDFKKAKDKEISSWMKQAAVKLASRDVPPGRLLRMRWLYTVKHDGRAKARLVIVGYQDPDLIHLEKTSPVMTRRTRGLFLTKCALHRWTALCGDVKSAFLQGLESGRDREIFAAPVEELVTALGGQPGDNVQILKACYMAWPTHLPSGLGQLLQQ